MNESWAEFVSTVTKSDGDTKAGKKIDVSRTTIYRWRKGQVPSPMFVMKLADAYGIPRETAYTAAGFMDNEKEDELELNLAAVPLDDLLAEIRRRAENR